MEKSEQQVKLLKEFITHIVREIIKNELEEETTTAAVDGISTPFAFSKKKTMEEDSKKKIDEMSATGGIEGYNIPSAFSKKGGSERGVKGSEKLGYTLTDAGRKEMSRTADKLL